MEIGGPGRFQRLKLSLKFAAAFAIYHYSPSASIGLETGYEKIALYTKNGEPTHAARQLPSGKWTSKISDNIDIEHDTLNAMIDFPPEMLCHLAYGGATHILQKAIVVAAERGRSFDFRA